MTDKPRAQRVQARKKKRNLKKAEKYENAFKRKESRAQKLELKGKSAKADRLYQEADNFGEDARRVKLHGKGEKPKSRLSMQVTKRSSERDLYRKSHAFRESSGGREIAKAVERENKRKARRGK
jgi:hypothetical protein